MRISARADYVLRAMAQLASEPAEQTVNAEHLAEAQDIPVRYLLGILGGAQARTAGPQLPRRRWWLFAEQTAG